MLLGAAGLFLLLAIGAGLWRLRGKEGPHRFLELAVAGLPAERSEWGRAMLAELAQVSGRRERWAFALSCASAALRAPAVTDSADRLLRGVTCLLLLACVALTVYGWFRYPSLRAGSAPYLVAEFVALLLYCLSALLLVRASGLASRTKLRPAAWAAILIGLSFFVTFVSITYTVVGQPQDVGDNLGRAIFALFEVPVLALGAGVLVTALVMFAGRAVRRS